MEVAEVAVGVLFGKFLEAEFASDEIVHCVHFDHHSEMREALINSYQWQCVLILFKLLFQLLILSTLLGTQLSIVITQHHKLDHE